MISFRKTAAALLAAVLTLALFATSCNTDPADPSSESRVPIDTSSTGSDPETPEPAPAAEFDLNTANAKILGKASAAKGGYTFSYGSSGFSVNFVGTEFWMYVPETPKEDNRVRRVTVAVLVDSDMAMDADMVSIDKSGWIKLADGLSDGEHHIEVRKQSRSFFGTLTSDWFNVTKFGVNEGGEVKAPDPLSDLVIEVYGDSISNGDAVWSAEEGILGDAGANHAYTFGTYTGVLERLLDADVRVTANTGSGLLGWIAAEDNGKPDNLLPPQNSWNVFDPRAGINEDYSHEGANAADVVIIDLGTADRTDYNNGDITDELFNKEYLRFIKQIKTDCPDAIVICTLGAMGGMAEFGDNLPRIVADANAWNGGKTFCYFLELQQCDTISCGYDHDTSHPGNLAHEIYGLQLATLINSALNLHKTLPTDIPESAYFNNAAMKDPGRSGTPIDSGLNVYGNVSVVENMFDSDTNTCWHPADRYDMGENCWAGIMYATSVKCTGVDIMWDDTTRPIKETGYILEYTADGTKWQEVPDISVEYIENEAGTLYCVDKITFPELTAKGIRVVVLENDAADKGLASQIYEFEVTVEEVARPDGNLMEAVTGRTDSLTRVQDALEGKNL